jgi:uncharacterized LabA/DUF88 family protein
LERLYVFIDGSNLYHGIREHVGDGRKIPIDMRRFAEGLAGKERRLVKILYYTAPISQQENKESYRAQQKFLSVLKQTSFLDLRLGRLVKRCRDFECERCGEKCQKAFHTEKGIDVFIASDLLVHAFDDQYDTAILVSEDGDFVPAVQEVQRLSKRVENAYFRPSHLSQRCDSFIKLSKAFIDDVRLDKNRR